MRLALVALIAVAAMAQNPLARRDPYVGTFEGQGVVLELKAAQGGYSGALTVQGQSFPSNVVLNAGGGAGTFAVNGQQYRFTLTPAGDGFVLASEGAEYRIERRGGATAANETKPIAAAGIVGTWRHPQGYAKFNADGTGEVDGNPGRYEIQGNQITMSGAAGRVTMAFAIEGDRLTFTGNGQSVVLNREKPSAPGSAGVRMELVGKWCWMSQTYANNGGARQSNRCITLEANGRYVYEGVTDSYNPYGGATGERRDTGTWEATDNTLTGRSVSGQVTTYRLEKRNHPKNVNDPMIILNGDWFVTFYKKAPW